MGLVDKLIEILELRKKKLTGLDIKYIVEAIAIADKLDNQPSEVEKKEQAESMKTLFAEYMTGVEA